MRILIVTAADESYTSLLRGLIRSLQQWQPYPYAALAVFDLGMSQDTRHWVDQHVKYVVKPGWDLPVSEQIRTQQPHARALTVRPFLPDYFPGYDIYHWIDADCWVQERYALDWYASAASRGALAVTPQVHHAYRHNQNSFIWRAERMHAYYGQKAAQQLSWASYVNAGVFALRAKASHWTLWRKAFEAGLNASGGNICCDQTALNHMLWTEGVPITPLPATCNWLCHLAMPAYDIKQQRLREPLVPGSPLGILHLAADTKDVRLQVREADGVREVGLRFPG